MRARLVGAILRHWPIKLAALALAVLLYARVQTQRVLTQSFTVPLEVGLPPGRVLADSLPQVRVTVAGRGADLLSMRSLPGIVTRQIPDTLSASEWIVHLQPADVRVPSGLDVTVVDVTPRDIAVTLNEVAVKHVPVVPRIRLVPDSGLALSTTPEVAPATVRLVGSEERVSAVDSVVTMVTQIRGVPGAFFQAFTIDTTLLPGLHVSPLRVSVAGEVGSVLERAFQGIPVESGAGDLSGVAVLPSRVVVIVSGPAARVRSLTRDSVHVVAHLAAVADTAVAFARLTVLAPTGVTARAQPDSVLLRRRGGD